MLFPVPATFVISMRLHRDSSSRNIHVRRVICQGRRDQSEVRQGWAKTSKKEGSFLSFFRAHALHATLSLNWRPEATKMVVLVADAPPHGMRE